MGDVIESLKDGERFTMDWTFTRRWWQFWKPRTWTERRLYVIAGHAEPLSDEQKREMWKRFDAAFDRMDEAFAEVDNAFKPARGQ